MATLFTRDMTNGEQRPFGLECALRCRGVHVEQATHGPPGEVLDGGKTYFYYHCVGLQKNVEHPCEVRQVRAELLEDAVFVLSASPRVRRATTQTPSGRVAIRQKKVAEWQTVDPAENYDARRSGDEDERQRRMLIGGRTTFPFRGRVEVHAKNVLVAPFV